MSIDFKYDDLCIENVVYSAPASLLRSGEELCNKSWSGLEQPYIECYCIP